MKLGAFLACVMCMHVKERKVKGAVPKELRLLRKAIFLSEMSNCLECIRMGRDSRYVDPKPKEWTFMESFCLHVTQCSL